MKIIIELTQEHEAEVDDDFDMTDESALFELLGDGTSMTSSNVLAWKVVMSIDDDEEVDDARTSQSEWDARKVQLDEALSFLDRPKGEKRELSSPT